MMWLDLLRKAFVNVLYADAGIGEAAGAEAAKGAGEAAVGGTAAGATGSLGLGGLGSAALGDIAGNMAISAATGGNPFSPTSLASDAISAVAPGLDGLGSDVSSSIGAGATDALSSSTLDSLSSGVLSDVSSSLGGVGSGFGATAGDAAITGVTGSSVLDSIGAGVGPGIAESALPGLESAAAGGAADLSSFAPAATDAGSIGTSGFGGASTASSAGAPSGTSAFSPASVTANGGNAAFAPAASSPVPLGDAGTAQALGIGNNPYGFVGNATSGVGPVPGISEGGGLTGSSISSVPQAAAANATQATPGFLDKALDFVVNNPGKALQYGLLAKNALTVPAALTRANRAAGTLQGNANAGSAFGTQGLANGGALTGAQNQALQDQFNQQLQQGRAQILQNAVNAGLDPNSSIVQQRIQQLTQQLTTQLEQAQMQQQQANIGNALTALGVSNQGAAQVAGQQYAENTGAQETFSQTGSLISQLNALGG